MGFGTLFPIRCIGQAGGFGGDEGRCICLVVSVCGEDVNRMGLV